jgi:hypothetical protein
VFRFEFTAVISWKYTDNIGQISKSNTLLYQTWFDIIRTIRLSTIDKRHNQSKKYQRVRRKHTNVQNEKFPNNKTAPIRTKNRTTTPRVTLTINKTPPPPPYPPKEGIMVCIWQHPVLRNRRTYQNVSALNSHIYNTIHLIDKCISLSRRIHVKCWSFYDSKFLLIDLYWSVYI